MVDRFCVLSLPVGKYYTSLSKSPFNNNYCCINKKNISNQFDTNELIVFDIFMKSVMAASSIVIVYTMTSEGHLSQIEAVNPNHGVPNIFPKYLIRLTFELNISKKTEPK